MIWNRFLIHSTDRLENENSIEKVSKDVCSKIV